MGRPARGEARAGGSRRGAALLAFLLIGGVLLPRVAHAAGPAPEGGRISTGILWSELDGEATAVVPGFDLSLFEVGISGSWRSRGGFTVAADLELGHATVTGGELPPTWRDVGIAHTERLSGSWAVRAGWNGDYFGFLLGLGMIAPLPFSEDFQVQRNDTETRVVRTPGLLTALGPLSGEMWVGVPDRLYFFWSLLAGGPGLGSGPVRFGIGHHGEHFSARAAWVGLIAPGPVLEVELPVQGELRLGGAVRAFVPQGFRKRGLGGYLFLAAHL